MTGKEPTKTERLLATYRSWQAALQTAPCSKYCSDLEETVYRLVGAVPPFSSVDWEALHREAYPIPAERPPRLLPDGLIEDLKISDITYSDRWPA